MSTEKFAWLLIALSTVACVALITTCEMHRIDANQSVGHETDRAVR